MAFYSQETIDDIASRSPIVEVVGEYVSLKPKGKKYWGCCPFHNEKTPSFSVDSERDLFYCFGCHKGGNVFTFVMETEHLEFGEAVRFLAERAHVDLPEQKSNVPHVTIDEKERVYEANVAAAKYFNQNLFTETGAEALDYLYKRGLNDKDIRKNGLGASGRGGLKAELNKQGFEDAILIKAGLIDKKDGRTYEMFRNRVMFPIIDAKKHVLGFGGRAMGDAQPKYLNTSETIVFNKRRGLYAINMAALERSEGRLVLVEGYMDVVSLRKYGVKAVVATLGTALTNEQARLMKRYTSEVWISYDGDSAGQHAAMRALDIFEAEGLKAKVIDYPGGMDPDDFVKANGLEGFNALKKYDATDYRLIRAKDDIDTGTLEGMTEYARRACAIIKKLQNPIEVENYVRQLVNETGYPRETLIRQIGVSVDTLQTPVRAHREFKKVTFDGTEGMLLRLLDSGLVPNDMIRPDDFDDELNKKCAEHLLSGGSIAAFTNTLNEDERTRLLAGYNADMTEISDSQIAVQTVIECRERIHKRRIEKKIAQIQEDMKKYPERKAELLVEFQRLQAQK